MSRRRLPHVGLNVGEPVQVFEFTFCNVSPDFAAAMGAEPIPDPAPIRVQATVGEPIREIEAE